MLNVRIKTRRGLEANRLAQVPSEGELLYITDKKSLHVGDGQTSGGYAVNADNLVHEYTDQSDASKSLSLAWWVARLNGAEGTIRIPAGTHAVLSDVTVPANVCLCFDKGAILSVASGKTLTINGPISAGLWQIFGGSGTVSGNPKIKKAYPEWFGAVGNGTTDDTASIQKVLNFCTGYKATAYFTKSYLISSTLTVLNNKLYCTKGSCFYGSPSVSTTYFDLKDGAKTEGLKLDITKVSINTLTAIGFNLDGSDIDMMSSDISGVHYGIYTAPAAVQTINNINIKHNKFNALRRDIWLNNQCISNLDISHNNFASQQTDNTYATPAGKIFMYFGYRGISQYTGSNASDCDKFTDAMYTTYCGRNIKVNDNVFGYTNTRDIHIMNAVGVECLNNKVSNQHGGDKATLGYSDDTIVLELCRSFKLCGNVIDGSGENGMDTLSCKNGVVNNNIMDWCDNYNLDVGISDTYTLGLCDSSFTFNYLVNQYITVAHNVCGIMLGFIDIRIGDHINVLGNNVNVDNGKASHWLVIMQSRGAILTLMTANSYKINNILYKGNITDEEQTYLSLNTDELTTAFDWGTIILDPGFISIKKTYTSVAANASIDWIQYSGVYNNCKVELLMSTNTANAKSYHWVDVTGTVLGKVTTNYVPSGKAVGDTIIKGVDVIGSQIYHVQLRTGDYLNKSARDMKPTGNITEMSTEPYITTGTLQITLW